MAPPTHRETRYETFLRSPEEAVQRAFDDYSERLPYTHPNRDAAFLWQGCLGVDGKTRYGSYRVVTRAMLDTRTHRIEFADGQASIFWLDVRHDPKTRTYVPVAPPRTGAV